MFQVMAEPYFRAIRVFRNYVEAETWLTSERLQMGIPSEIIPVNSPGGPPPARDVPLTSDAEQPSAVADAPLEPQSEVSKLGE
jgi:hypothetical protein